MKIPYKIHKSSKQFFKILNRISVKITGKRVYHIKVLLQNKWLRIYKKSISNKYLFILSPPFCGSTLLSEVLSTSNSVSTNNTRFQREGQKLPKVREIMFTDLRWDENVDYDWIYIKKEWRKYWDITKPILLQKSPSNLVRAKSIENHFTPSYFIIWVRNPYAHCESLLRREKRKYSSKTAAEFAVKCLYYQKENAESLKNVFLTSYENLVFDPLQFADKIQSFLPDLGKVETSQEFKAHNFKNRKMKINNLNREKISKLTPDQLQDINLVFRKNIDILKYFNYSLIK